jgi:hypothetical protein
MSSRSDLSRYQRLKIYLSWKPGEDRDVLQLCWHGYGGLWIRNVFAAMKKSTLIIVELQHKNLDSGKCTQALESIFRILGELKE